jgi:hypothetical protein
MLFYKVYHTKVVSIKAYLNLPLLSNTIRYYIISKSMPYQDVEKNEIIQVLNILLDEGCDPCISNNAFIYDLISCQDTDMFNIIISRIKCNFDYNILNYALNFKNKDISKFFIKNVYISDYSQQIDIMYKLMLKNNIESLQYCLEHGYSITSSKTSDIMKYYSDIIHNYLNNLKDRSKIRSYIHKDVVEYQFVNYLV